MEDKKIAILDNTSRIVSAYLNNNKSNPTDVELLFESVFMTASKLIDAQPAEQASIKPYVPVSHSLHKDHLVCLECGHGFKSLKRHLKSRHEIVPDEYRRKWGLPSHYPMVAPLYAEKRSQLAIESNLGYSRRKSM
ncbi:MAG: MucR family transcriptional regulator [Pseudomonadota bacterium]